MQFDKVHCLMMQHPVVLDDWYHMADITSFP